MSLGDARAVSHVCKTNCGCPNIRISPVLFRNRSHHMPSPLQGPIVQHMVITERGTKGGVERSGAFIHSSRSNDHSYTSTCNCLNDDDSSHPPPPDQALRHLVCIHPSTLCFHSQALSQSVATHPPPRPDLLIPTCKGGCDKMRPWRLPHCTHECMCQLSPDIRTESLLVHRWFAMLSFCLPSQP